MPFKLFGGINSVVTNSPGFFGRQIGAKPSGGSFSSSSHSNIIWNKHRQLVNKRSSLGLPIKFYTQRNGGFRSNKMANLFYAIANETFAYIFTKYSCEYIVAKYSTRPFLKNPF